VTNGFIIVKKKIIIHTLHAHHTNFNQVNKSLNQEGFWSFITYLIDDLDKQIQKI